MSIEVDLQDNPIGVRPREDFYTGKYIHRASQMILRNPAGEILLQKRAPDKRWFPNRLTYSVSGTVDEESYEECMRKELGEELGLDIPFTYLFTFPCFTDVDKVFSALYEARLEEGMELHPDMREMTEVLWLSEEFLREDIIANPDTYTPSFVEGMKEYLIRKHYVSN